jgi:hypothetical protein
MKYRIATRASVASAAGVLTGILGFVLGADWTRIIFCVNGVILGVFVATSTSRFAETIAIVSTVGMLAGWGLNGYFSLILGLPALSAGLLVRCAMYLLADDEASQAKAVTQPAAASNVETFRRKKEGGRYAA